MSNIFLGFQMKNLIRFPTSNRRKDAIFRVKGYFLDERNGVFHYAKKAIRKCHFSCKCCDEGKKWGNRIPKKVKDSHSRFS